MKKLIFALATGLAAAIASIYGVSASTAVADPCNGSPQFCAGPGIDLSQWSSQGGPDSRAFASMIIVSVAINS
jgi:hypothetical protein